LDYRYKTNQQSYRS